MAWTRYIPVVIDHTKVNTATQTNFTIPLALTSTELKTLANSGLVTNASGFDIAVFSDAACTTMLKFTRVAYSATAGTWAAWVKIPSLSNAVDTTVYVGYANTSVTTDQNDAANSWDASTAAAYHFGDGTTLNLADHSGSFALANGGSAVAAAGLIGGAVSTNGTSQYLERTSSSPVTAYPATLEAVFKPAAAVSTNRSVISLNGRTAASVGLEIRCRATDAVRGQAGNATAPLTANSVLNTTNWHYAGAVFTNDTSRGLLVDGAASITSAASASPLATIDSIAVGCNVTSSTQAFFFNGLTNVVIVSSVARSDGWCTTRYNATVGIASFSAAGAPAAVGGGGAVPRAAHFMAMGLL